MNHSISCSTQEKLLTEKLNELLDYATYKGRYSISVSHVSTVNDALISLSGWTINLEQ